MAFYCWRLLGPSWLFIHESSNCSLCWRCDRSLHSPFLDLSSFERVLPPSSKLPAAGHPFLTLNVLISYIPSTFIDSSGFVEPVQIPSNLCILKVRYTAFTSFVAFNFSCLFKHIYGAEIRTWTLEPYFYSAAAPPSCILRTMTTHCLCKDFHVNVSCIMN